MQDELTESKGVLIATTGTNNLYEVDTSALFRALLLAGDSAEGGENQFDEIKTSEHRAHRMSQADLVRYLHEKLGHVSLQKLKKTIQGGLKTGTDITIDAIDKAIRNGFTCNTCDLAKITKGQEPRSSGHIKCKGILERVHTDTMVRPCDMTNRRGNRYTQLFID